MIYLKRVLIIITITLSLLSVLSNKTQADFMFININSEEVPHSLYLGDVNADGKIDVGDAISVLRHIVGLSPLDDPDLWQRADVNLDGEVSVSDAIMILRSIVGLIHVFPVNEPAFVSTERALNYVIKETSVATVNLSGDIVLTDNLDLGRNITLNGESKEGKISTITGAVTLVDGVNYLTARNLIINGSLIVDSGGAINIDLLNNCDIYQVVFISGNAFVTGGKNIRNAWISVNAEVVFDEQPDIAHAIDINQSDIERTSPERVPAGEDNIELVISLKDFLGNPIEDSYKVLIDSGTDTWFNDKVSFDAEGKAILSLTVTKAGEYKDVSVKVKDIIIDYFNVTVEPLSIDGEESGVYYDDVVTAGDSNIFLKLTIKDKYQNPISGTSRVEVKWDNRSQTTLSAIFSSGGEWFTPAISIRTAGEFSFNVYVDEIMIQIFGITVEPAVVERLYIEKQLPGIPDGSGDAGEFHVITVDRFNNKSTVGLNKNVDVTAILSNVSNHNNISLDGNITKDIGSFAGNGKVVFDNLYIKGSGSTVELSIIFNSDNLRSVESKQFDILKLSGINDKNSSVIIIDKNPVADEKNIELNLQIKDSAGNPVSGRFYTMVGDGWYEDRVDFDNGAASILTTKTEARQYSNIKVFVDGFNIGSFDVTVNPGAAKQIEFEDKQSGAIVLKPGELLDISVIVSDQYGNTVGNETVHISAFLLTDEKEWSFEYYPFDSGTDEQVTNNSGIARFNDLQLNIYGFFEIVFTIEDEEISELKSSVGVIPDDSSVLWVGYDDPVEAEIYEEFFIILIPEDEDGNRIEGLSRDSFDYSISDQNTGNPVSFTKENTRRFSEIQPGFYLVSFMFFDAMEMEITVLLSDEPIGKVMVKITEGA